MNKDKMGVQERLTLYVIDDDGNVVDVRYPYTGSTWQRIKKALGFGKCICDDIVLDTGLADVAYLIANRYEYMQFGNGTTTPAHDDSGLESPLFDRCAAATSLTTTFYTNDTARFTATVTPTYDVNFSEAILCKNATGGGDDVIFAHETYTPVSVVADNSMIGVWDVIVMR